MSGRKKKSNGKKELNDFTCPLLSPAEAALVTVPFDNIEDEKKGVKAAMQAHGFCIVTDVATSSECDDLQNLLDMDVSEIISTTHASAASSKLAEAVERCARDGLTEWPSASVKALGKKNRFQLKGLPHGRFAWEGRMHPNVQKVYQILHETEDLVSSCDNSFFSPMSAPEEASNRFWPHVDQNDHDAKIAAFDVYQGLLYCWPSTDSRSSTTVVWPGSHLPEVYGKYMSDPNLRHRGECGRHFTPISSMTAGEDKTELTQGWLSYARRVPVPAGGLLIWSSRTTHQGWSGGPRMAQPVCWEPRERRSERARERKLALAALGLPSTHSASLGQPHHLVPMIPPKETEAVTATNYKLLVLPLKPTIRSVALKDEIDPMDVWHHFHGVDLQQSLSKESRTLLASVIKDEYQKVL